MTTAPAPLSTGIVRRPDVAPEANRRTIASRRRRRRCAIVPIVLIVPPTLIQCGAVMTRDQELWAIALWVEKNHGDGAADYIGQQVRRLALQGAQDGIDLWLAVADRFDALQEPVAHA